MGKRDLIRAVVLAFGVMIMLSCSRDELTDIALPVEYDECGVEVREFISEEGDTLTFMGNWVQLKTLKDVMYGSDAYKYETYREDGTCKILFYIPDYDIWEYRYDAVYNIDTGEQIGFFLFGMWWE